MKLCALAIMAATLLLGACAGGPQFVRTSPKDPMREHFAPKERLVRTHVPDDPRIQIDGNEIWLTPDQRLVDLTGDNGDYAFVMEERALTDNPNFYVLFTPSWQGSPEERVIFRERRAVSLGLEKTGRVGEDARVSMSLSDAYVAPGYHVVKILGTPPRIKFLLRPIKNNEGELFPRFIAVPNKNRDEEYRIRLHEKW